MSSAAKTKTATTTSAPKEAPSHVYRAEEPAPPTVAAAEASESGDVSLLRLPVGWIAVPSDDGDVYYWQESTGVTTWDKPPMPPPPRRR